MWRIWKQNLKETVTGIWTSNIFVTITILCFHIPLKLADLCSHTRLKWSKAVPFGSVEQQPLRQSSSDGWKIPCMTVVFFESATLTFMVFFWCSLEKHSDWPWAEEADTAPHTSKILASRRGGLCTVRLMASDGSTDGIHWPFGEKLCGKPMYGG